MLDKCRDMVASRYFSLDILFFFFKVTQSCPTLCDPTDCPWNSLGQNTGVGSLSFLQGIFPTQGSNPGLLHCRRILYQLSHKGNPLESPLNSLEAL